jgi:bacillithiol biosynthesis cysteine-adding enzyme BshC
MMTQPMECHCIPAVELPHTTRLYSTYIQKFSSVAEYYSHPPTLESVRKVATNLQIDAAMRSRVAEVLRKQNEALGSDASVTASLDRFAAGAAVIVTGQQVGLFSGPAYTIYKALHALRIANDLTAAGTPTVAVFWLATEDHDLAEINHCYWPTKNGAERLELADPGPAFVGKRVGEVPLGDEVAALVERAAGALDGPAAAAIARALRESYGAAETYGTAFGRLMARLFAGRGLILIDPLSPELHRLAAPVYRAALDQHAEITKDLIERGKALEKADYHAQVKVVERSTLLFVSEGGQRTPLIAHGSDPTLGFTLGERKLSGEDVAALLEKAPELFSPNALLRPIVQDTLLGSIAIIAGPAEIAYYAQSSVIYKRLLGRMPVIMPRATFTVVPPHLVRLLGKYDLKLSDFFEGRQALRKKMERGSVPPELAQQFDAGEKALRDMLEGMRQPIATLDPTLSGSLENAESKILYNFTALREKVARAMAFRSSVIDGHERQLTEVLYHDGALQERSLCLLPMLAAQGIELLDELLKRIPADATNHQVVYL